MQLGAINSLNFKGYNALPQSKAVSNPQQNASENYSQINFEGKEHKKRSHAMRNAALGLMLATTVPCAITSCSKDDPVHMGIDVTVNNKINIDALVFPGHTTDTVYIQSPPDTIRLPGKDSIIYKTDTITKEIIKEVPVIVPIDYYPPVAPLIIKAADSLKIPVTGKGEKPVPIRMHANDPYNNAEFFLSFNLAESTDRQMSFDARVVDKYKNPKGDIRHARFQYSDVDGTDIYVKRQLPKDKYTKNRPNNESDWQESGEARMHQVGGKIIIEGYDAEGKEWVVTGDITEAKKMASIFWTSIISGTNPQEEQYQEFTELTVEVADVSRNADNGAEITNVEVNKDQFGYTASRTKALNF